MANIEFGELTPRLTTQEDPMACMSACLLSQISPESDLTEEDINGVLKKDGLFAQGMGVDLHPAVTINQSAGKLGLSAQPLYDTRLLDENEESKIVERLAKIEATIRSGKSVMLAFPKRREGQESFLHFCIVSGYTETADGSGVVLMDPSEIDGGVESPTWEELIDYVKPDEEIAVMAWGIGKESEPFKENSENKNNDGGLPGFSLLAKPIYKEEETGEAIPTGTDHPCSVAIPTSDITKLFASQGNVVLSREGNHPAGYPRFVVPPAVKNLSLSQTGSFSNLPYPSRQSAKAAAYMENTYGDGADITESDGLFWMPDSNYNSSAWQHTGLGISSRQAKSTLEGNPGNNLERRNKAEDKIKNVIGEHTGANFEDIYLFPTGMASIYWLNQALINMSDEAPAVQFGFPYADTYDQRYYGPSRNVSKNILDIRNGNYEELQALADSGQSIRGVFTEYPSNPLLWTPDFQKLDHMTNAETPVVVDDTIGTMLNLDDSKLPDCVVARVTSLTKFFSSVGDVMGGSIVLRPQSPHYDHLKTELDKLYEDTVWYEDAEVLAQNSDLFPKVMPTINENGEALATWLSQEWSGRHRPLQDVYYPGLKDKETFDTTRKASGGYGGLMSLQFKDARNGFKFFDNLKVTKGPSLGTYYTLGCLYTYLAHKPIGSVEKFGVTPDLVRISAGIEDIHVLKDRFAQAFEKI